VNFNLTLGQCAPIREQWAPLVCITGDESTFNELYDSPTRQNVLQFLTLDRRNPNSIASCVEAARKNAHSIREVIPVGIWEQLNKFYFMVQDALAAGELREPSHFCEQVKLASHVIDGMCESTMSHGEQWHFTRLGRLLERADKTSRMIDVQYYLLLPKPNDVGTALDVVRWSSLLKSTTSLSTYRQRHGGIVPLKVADFLILDRHFPRSMHFCLIHAQNSLRAIAGTTEDAFQFRSEQYLGRLRSDLDYTRIEDVVEHGLHEFVDDFQCRLNQIGNLVHTDFFTIPQRQQRVPIRNGLRQAKTTRPLETQLQP
jgi:uncharacterized alpha-E superfamily protein